MNKELLFHLYEIHSPSGSEKQMRRFVRKQAYACGATSVETDKFGNLLVVKGESETYPCLAAHLDQVQRNHSRDFRVVEIDGDVLGWSPKCHEQQGLGADDKNGIFICLEMLRKFDALKCVFFVQEETGGHGSDNVSLDFFKDCRFVIEPDRKGCSDLITSMCCGNVCSEDFQNAIGYQQYNYRFDRGTFTDVANLVERGVGISCLNLSCGYYSAHTDHEITVLAHLQNCMDFVEHIIETCTDVYPFVYEAPTYSYGKYGLGKYGDWYDSSNWYRNLGKGQASTTPALTAQKSTYGKVESLALTEDVDFDSESAEEYVKDGYYDADLDTMRDFLRMNPGLSIYDLRIYNTGDFYVYDFFDYKDHADNVLAAIYNVVVDEMILEDDDDDYNFDDVYMAS